MKQMKYSLIYADPPWSFKCWSTKGDGRGAVHHYDVMALEDIMALPIAEIAVDDSVLLMWVIFPLLPQALDVIRSWGFKYKACAFTWVKKNRKSNSWFWGLGYYTRANAEVCLLATRGKGLPRISRSVHSIIDTPVEAHSKKPDIARDKIVQLFGDVPRIELFARQRTKGWDCLGYDIDGRDIRDGLNDILSKTNDETHREQQVRNDPIAKTQVQCQQSKQVDDKSVA
jgi:N6-adenosine-specific RNA methylase IME4